MDEQANFDRQAAISTPYSTPKPTPKFSVNLLINHFALVVDCNGVAWWVDPDKRSITLAE